MALLTILDYATAVAVGSAASQQANLEALLAPFGAGPITARLESPSGTHLRTLTIPLPTIEATTPRRFVLGAHLADAAVAVGTPGRWVMRTAGGLAVFALTAGTSGADVNHVGAVKTLCTPTLQGVAVTAPAGLPPAGMPTWRVGRTPMQWSQVSGTQAASALSSIGFGDRACNAYNHLVVDSQGRIYILAWGGHEDGSSNGCARMNLMANSPSWAALFAGSSSVQANVLYYADGRPTSRHTYAYTHLIEDEDALLLAGCKFGYGNGTPGGPGFDVFDLLTNDYRARFNYPDSPDNSQGVVKDNNGNIWTPSGYKLDVATKTWSRPHAGFFGRFPAATDPTSDRSFWLQYGDSQGFNLELGVLAREVNHADGSIRNITIASGAARTAFEAAQPSYPSMSYCTADGKFWFFHAGEPNVAYKVTPDLGSTTWAMERVVIGGVTPVTTGAILMERCRWVSGLNGFIAMFKGDQDLYFCPVT